MLNFEKWNLYNIYKKIKCTFPSPTPLLFYNKSKGGSTIYKKLQTRKTQLDLLIKDTKNKLTNLPEGKLICCGDQFYRSDGRNKTYIKKQDQILAEKLAVKKYLSALLEDLEKEKCATDMYLRHYPKNSKVDDIYSLPNSFQRLLSSHFSPLSKELDEWMKSPYPTNPKHPEHLSIKIGPSEFVRSKSEAMIAKMLKQYQIPYRYESQLILGDITLYPDFTIRHPKTGETFLWEHHGMLEIAEYQKNMLNKMQLYVSNNILPGINLITTYETQEKPLTFEIIEMYIQYYFI